MQRQQCISDPQRRWKRWEAWALAPHFRKGNNFSPPLLNHGHGLQPVGVNDSLKLNKTTQKLKNWPNISLNVQKCSQH